MIVWTPEAKKVAVPEWVRSLEAFRRWTDTDEFPEQSVTWWLKGEVWVDMSKEQIFSHLAVKGEYHRVLGGLAKWERPGLLLPDGLLLSNFAADISGNPDATYISNETLRSDRIRLIEGVEGGYVEIQGSPDMTLEIVSRSSWKKDTEILMRAYWEAGVREYWLVDARESPPRFDIYQMGRNGYVATRKSGGWLKSNVFGKSFRLRETKNALGHPEYQLDVK